jgi:hypothetical protein
MNEPAFPTNYFYDQETEHEVLPMPGMTLRDYFAAKAMSEMTWQTKSGSARECYEIADAMLKARQQ